MRHILIALALAPLVLTGCGVKGPPQPFSGRSDAQRSPEPFAEGTRRGGPEGFDQDARTVSQVGTRAGRDRAVQANVPVGSRGQRGGRRFILDPLL